MVQSILAYALAYADRGWYVFPARPDAKQSYKSAEYSPTGLPWGATADRDEIIADFTKHPDANIGIPTGPRNGIWVLDIDNKESGNGFESLTALTTTPGHGPLPPTLTAISSSGSAHYYFAYPAGGATIRNSTSRLGPGIDVRGDGGMVIAPPSARKGSRYVWSVLRPVADAPTWLFELVREQPHIIPPPAACPGPINLTELINALATIPADNRWEWFEVGCALYNEAGEAGWPLFDAWSRTAVSHYDRKENRKQWESIMTLKRSRYSKRTIFFLARKYHNNTNKGSINDDTCRRA
jgi:hypothetical protein